MTYSSKILRFLIMPSLDCIESPKMGVTLPGDHLLGSNGTGLSATIMA